MGAEEGAWAVGAAVLVSLFAALITHSLTCSERHACLQADTCYALTNSSLGCSFRTSVTPAGWKLLNATDASRSLDALGRGVCTPGLRQNVDPFTGRLQCVRQRLFPNALNTEIMQATTTGTTSDHDRYCGEWIDARHLLSGEERWAFYDEPEVNEDIESVVRARGGGRLAGTDVSKFRAACRTMVASNAVGPAGELAYRFLLDKLGDLSAAPLEAVGILASYACEAPAQVGLTSHGAGFAVYVSAGAVLSESEVDEILYAVGGSHEDRVLAQRVAAAMAGYDAASLVAVDAAAIHRVVHGSWSFDNPDYDADAAFALHYDARNPSLERFQRVLTERPAAEVAAYLRALAATCSFATQSIATGALGDLSASRDRLAARQAERVSPLAGLGRLRSVPHHRFGHVNATHVQDATTTTWSSLGFFAASYDDARSQCVAAARMVFPDQFDHLTFDLLVSDLLYERLSTVTLEIRDHVEDALQTPLFSQLHGGTGQSLALTNLRRTTLRVAGAPRGTWAGVAQTFSRPVLAASDGALLMMLKQARAVFLDRFKHVTNGDNICQHPPLYDARERNAYLIVSGSYSCAMLLPGLLVPPFADERYDDESLYSRVGYVISHEFAHVTALETFWDMEYASLLLRDYARSTWVEAAADVLGIAAIVNSGKATAAQLCGHVSQLWCARTSLLGEGQDALFGSWHEHSHPPANERADLACAFLRRHFGTSRV
tara:strand:- start:1332 stop:3488 length:2157 start_codon:yes stop_codon:yes gene_type:complete